MITALRAEVCTSGLALIGRRGWGNFVLPPAALIIGAGTGYWSAHQSAPSLNPALLAAVLSLAQRVRYRDDPDSDYPRHFPGRLRIHLRTGEVLEHHEPINRGCADRPLTENEVRDKFRRNALRVLPHAQAEAAIAAVAGLDQHAMLTPVTSTLIPH